MGGRRERAALERQRAEVAAEQLRLANLRDLLAQSRVTEEARRRAVAVDAAAAAARGAGAGAARDTAQDPSVEMEVDASAARDVDGAARDAESTGSAVDPALRRQWDAEYLEGMMCS